MKNKTTTMCNRTVLIVFLTVAFSCGGEKAILRADLNLALRLSGENRPELEKVLRHYSENDSDSLKLKAAKFLISNMIRHYSFGGEYMENHIARVDSVYAAESSITKTLYYMIPFYAGTVSHELRIEPDVLCIKGDFLIDNIVERNLSVIKNNFIFNSFVYMEIIDSLLIIKSETKDNDMRFHVFNKKDGTHKNSFGTVGRAKGELLEPFSLISCYDKNIYATGINQKK